MTIVATAIHGTAVEPLTVNAGNDLLDTNVGFSACGAGGPTGIPDASVTGGVEPYTFLWEQIGTPAQRGPYTPSNSAILNPTWTDPSVCDGDFPAGEDWRLTVTDDDLNEGSDSIQVTLVWVNIS